MLVRLRLLTAGESHGPALTAVLEGIPAGLPLDVARIDAELARRQRGFGSGGRMAIERDRVEVLGGLLAGETTGAPLALRIENRDWANWRDREIPPYTVPRPGHADLTGAIKFGHRDLRFSLERASARETAARVAAGAVCRQLLERVGVRVGGYVLSIGPVEARLPEDLPYEARFARAEANDLRCPDPEAAEEMRAAIRAAMAAKDTLGGTFEVVALGVPPGLGSFVQWDRRLDARLAAALMSVPAVKGVEIGLGFRAARRPGSQVHDPIERTPDGRLVRPTNRAGGLEGGVTNGEPVVVRAAMKPIATVLKGLPSVDLATGRPTSTRYERSDFCAVPRAVVVGEAMVCLVLADALLEKVGGDSLDEVLGRVRALRRARLEDLPLADRPWRWLEPGPPPSGQKPDGSVQ